LCEYKIKVEDGAIYAQLVEAETASAVAAISVKH
jgi:hypothetical protein